MPKPLARERIEDQRDRRAMNTLKRHLRGRITTTQITTLFQRQARAQDAVGELLWNLGRFGTVAIEAELGNFDSALPQGYFLPRQCRIRTQRFVAVK